MDTLWSFFIFQSEPVELLSHLYIGNALSAAGKEVLVRHGITAILNVSNNCQNHFDTDFRYKNIPVDDNPLVDLSTWFMESISFIGTWMPLPRLFITWKMSFTDFLLFFHFVEKNTSIFPQIRIFLIFCFFHIWQMSAKCSINKCCLWQYLGAENKQYIYDELTANVVTFLT